MRVSSKIRYSAEPGRVFAMLTDPAFQERKLEATGALRQKVTVLHSTDGGIHVRSERELPTDHVPDLVKGLVGPTLTVVQVEDWLPEAADGSRPGTVTVEIKGAPVRLNGTIRLAPDGDGTTETVDAELKAKVPLIGGRIERAAEPAITGAMQLEERTGHAWLAEH